MNPLFLLLGLFGWGAMTSSSSSSETVTTTTEDTPPVFKPDTPDANKDGGGIVVPPNNSDAGEENPDWVPGGDDGSTGGDTGGGMDMGGGTGGDDGSTGGETGGMDMGGDTGGDDGSTGGETGGMDMGGDTGGDDGSTGGETGGGMGMGGTGGDDGSTGEETGGGMDMGGDTGGDDGSTGGETGGVDMTSDDTTDTVVSGVERVPPSLDPNDYDRVIIGETFTETVDVNQDYDNTLFVDCTFTDIDGYGMRLGDVSNVTIYNCSFENISGTGILLRSTLSTESVSIISNTFEDIGGDGIHAAKRYETGVDHDNLLIQDNQIHDVGLNGGSVYHGIYTQSSEALIWGNSITGYVDSNAISVRGDGIVWDNYINVTSGREYGSAIKYYSDHETGDSKTLIIADNVIESSSLYSGIELSIPTGAIPDSYAYEDWVVNDFLIMGNTIDARNDYVIDPLLQQQSWASVEISTDDTPETSTATLAGFLPEIQVEEAAFLPETEDDPEFDFIL